MISPGHVLIGAVVLALVIVAMRLSLERRRSPRRHLVIIGGALFAFGAVFRIFDVLEHIDQPRWSAAVGALGLLAYLTADSELAEQVRSWWRRRTGQNPAYTGPERRHPGDGKE